jgi:type IV fimbrial biogenesis protein FimT
MSQLAPHRQRVGSAWQGGFTLIELMVTIALLAILMRLAVPSFTGWLNNAQMRSVADALQNGLRKARSEAALRNRQVVFSLTDQEPATARENAVARANGSNWVVRTVEEFSNTEFDEYLEGGSFGEQVRNVAIQGPIGVCFNSVGRLVNNTAPGMQCSVAAVSYDVTRPGAERRLRITVTPGGEIRMCDPDKSIANSPDGC